MNKQNTSKYTATITIGLQAGYTEQLLTKAEVIAQLQKFQDQLISTEGVYLSAAVSECDVVLSGQIEPSVKLDFINYPKFPLAEDLFKKHILMLTEQLMNSLRQNRVVIIFHNEIVMLENNNEIDPRIIKS